LQPADEALSFGNRLAFPLAEAAGEPSLFKGKGFTRTDIKAA